MLSLKRRPPKRPKENFCQVVRDRHPAVIGIKELGLREARLGADAHEIQSEQRRDVRGIVRAPEMGEMTTKYQVRYDRMFSWLGIVNRSFPCEFQ